MRSKVGALGGCAGGSAVLVGTLADGLSTRQWRHVFREGAVWLVIVVPIFALVFALAVPGARSEPLGQGRATKPKPMTHCSHGR
jgi:hypothetical protein